MNKNNLILPADYSKWLAGLKRRIAGARQRAALAANAEQIRLYHDIGREILDRQDRVGWGIKVIDRISSDLRETFPDMKGFSVRNLHYMRLFAEQCPKLLFLQQSAAEMGQQSADLLPWFHIVTLLTQVSEPAIREWYAREAVRQAWPRDTFVAQIKSQLNFYLAAVDAQIKAPDDKPTIGLLLCKTKKRLVAEYALSGMAKPMGVAEYQLVRALPKPLDTCLPTIEELEIELARDFDQEAKP